ncbi:MAG TPA: SH3 domain-containing protein [Fontimonas sp.]
MGLLLAAGAMSCAYAEQAAFAQDLTSFLERIPDAPQRLPRSFKTDLPSISSSNGKRIVSPALELVAGRLDSHTCLYQLRLHLRWSGAAIDEEDAAEGGRSVLQKTACASLVQEATAVAIYEVSALQRKLQQGGRFASNNERDQIIAAARHAPVESVQVLGNQLDAVTIASRVNLRATPSLKSPVLSKLAAASLIQVVKTTKDEWYQLQGRPGYIHASALASVHEASLSAPPPAQIEDVASQRVLATVSGRVMVREQPEKTAKVLKRLQPGTQLRLLPTDVAGWFELDDGSGFVADEGLVRALKTGTTAAAVSARGARSAP